MTNKSRIKGTAAETAVVRYLRANGFEDADRPALHGANDIGDIIGIPDTCIEVKNCKTVTIEPWLKELRREYENSGAMYGGLWVKRYRHSSPEDWPVYIPGDMAEKLQLFRHGLYPVPGYVMVPGSVFVWALAAEVLR